MKLLDEFVYVVCGGHLEITSIVAPSLRTLQESYAIHRTLLSRRILPSKNMDATSTEVAMAAALAITIVVDGWPAPSPLAVSAELYLG